MAGRDNEFVSSNYGVRTTPRKEFEIATGRRACPPEDMLDRKGRRVRVMRRVEELAALRLTQAARLTEEEIVSVVRRLASCAHSRRLACSAMTTVLTKVGAQVLYTGPMFQVPLRPWPCAVLCGLGWGLVACFAPCDSHFLPPPLRRPLAPPTP
jgi:hypothetical protein